MIAHISLGSFIFLVAAGITYGIIIGFRDLFPHTTPVAPKHFNDTVTNRTTDRILIDFYRGNETFEEDLEKLFYNSKRTFIYFYF